MAHHQRHLSHAGFRLYSKLQSLHPNLLLLLLLMLSVASVWPSMAESETNDLNTLVTSQQSNILRLKQMSVPRQYSGYARPVPLPYGQYPSVPYTAPLAGAGGGCPLCDSSVYSYCSHKLMHDSCCCDFPGAVYQRPPQCGYYDCSLLFAKSCYEHALIKNCCCNNPY